MTRTLTLLAFAAGLALPAGAFAHPGPHPAGAHENAAPAAATGPAATVEAFHAALKRGDGAGATALLADDVQIFEEGYVEASKAEYLASHLPSDMVFTQATESRVTRREQFAQGGVAWVMTQSAVTGAYKGKPVDRVSIETMVLQETPAGWRIKHIHWSSRPATTKP